MCRGSESWFLIALKGVGGLWKFGVFVLTASIGCSRSIETFRVGFDCRKMCRKLVVVR